MDKEVKQLNDYIDDNKLSMKEVTKELQVLGYDGDYTRVRRLLKGEIKNSAPSEQRYFPFYIQIRERGLFSYAKEVVDLSSMDLPKKLRKIHLRMKQSGMFPRAEIIFFENIIRIHDKLHELGVYQKPEPEPEPEPKPKDEAVTQVDDPASETQDPDSHSDTEDPDSDQKSQTKSQ